tara:strand:- start:6710 stop:7471 length:762 start_codon:yes stop_codon:yes gene_type:complete
MTVETGTYINSLNAQFPPETDALSEIDEHLKIIKSTIKNTFPNVDAAVTATPAELNTKTAIVSDGTNATFNTNITAAKIKTLVGISEPAITTATDSEGEVTPALATGITAAEVWNLVKAEALNSTYPIGSIYTSVANTSPASAFGGTWAPYGAGKVLAGHDYNDPADAEFVAASTDGSSEKTGGSKTHTLTINEMPAHTHSFTAMQDTNNSVNRTGGGDLGAPSSTTTSSTGGGAAHNIMQPYVVVYMWKRTA